MTFTVTPRCLHCWFKRNWCLFLLSSEKNGINPSPTCFLDFPKHLLCLLHTKPLASQTSCLSCFWDKSTHCLARSMHKVQNVCKWVMEAGCLLKQCVKRSYAPYKKCFDWSFSLTYSLANKKWLWQFLSHNGIVIRYKIRQANNEWICIYQVFASTQPTLHRQCIVTVLLRPVVLGTQNAATLNSLSILSPQVYLEFLADKC